MAKEWARFGSGQFMQQATSPQQHMSGHPNGIQLPPPPLPHLPLSPYNPLLQYADRDRQHSPSFLLHGKPMPLACSPSPNPSPNHLLGDRLQSPCSPFLRHSANQFVTPSSPSSPKFGCGTNDGRRLSIPTPPVGLPYHMSPGGRSSVSPVGLPPSPLWRSNSNPGVYPEGEKGRSVVSSADVQDRLRYLAQQRSWQKEQGKQPEASLRTGFGTALPQPSPERSPSSLSALNGPFGGLGGLAVPSVSGSPSCDQTTTTKKSVGVLGHKDEKRSAIPGSRHDGIYGSHQLLPTANPTNQSLCALQRQATFHLSAHKGQPSNSHNTGRTSFINGYDSNSMESSRMKMSKPSSVSGSVMIPSRPPPAYPQNGVAFAKSSAPTLQTKKPSIQESQRKNPDMLSREREQEILADIQKRFSLPSDHWSSKIQDSNKLMSNKTGSQPVKKESSDKVKIKKRKKIETSLPTKPEQDKDENLVKAQTKLDPMLEKVSYIF
ncbi:uncharacterized protein LOC135471327 [Liolophura sinensis]|uniref:uncharacterized protein LOC135471327 n=1 Tax=Liolophura sinensis TaxID=3198878 RepID=UPI003158EBC6